jgi:hypothetical protein
MTVKEKAQELLSTYRFALSIPNAPLGEYKDNIAKQCALIAVDEISWILNEISYNADIDSEMYFYNQVKQEIEKL